MRLEPLDKTQIENAVSKAINDAVDFIEAEIAPQRVKAQRYFDGKTDLGYEEGRSQVVATKCREVVRAVKPSLHRVFLTSDKPVEFVPHGPEDVAFAEQATQWASYIFQKNNGFRILNDVMQDALVKKSGIAKVYYDTTEKTEIHMFTGLTDEAFALLVDDDDVEVLEHSVEMSVEYDEQGMSIEMPMHDVKISRTEEEGRIKIESVPPEDFFVDRNARSIDDFYICGHRSDMRVSDLLAMGFKIEDLDGIEGSDYSAMDDEAEFERRGYTVDENENEGPDAASKRITVTEAYMELDIEGTGVPRLYQFICAGANYKLLNFYEADCVPFAIFEADPEPHAFFGTSLVELVINDQDAATSMLRGVLDNVALTNNPALQIQDGMVNVDDLLNNEVGRVVRVKNMGAIAEMAVPFTAGSTLPALQYFDQLVQDKTGISKAAQGLDPDVLQSASATAVAATIQGQAGQVEVIARNLAEGGMRQLFKLILELSVKHSDGDEIMRLNGFYVPVSPQVWNAEMDVTVNVGIGTGREAERAASLQMALQMQQMIYQTYGPQNGLVTLTQIRNTMGDLLALGGIRNSDRYFMPMNLEAEQQMMMAQQQMAAMQPPPPDPNMAFMQTEQMKAQTRAQIDMAKAQMDQQYKMHKLAMDDDLQRDEMVQDLAVKVAEILGKYGAAVNVQQIKDEQAAVREHNAQMMGMMGGY
jgi:hypothetical protein